MNLYGFSEFLGPVWTFCSFLTIQAVFRKERLDAIFSLSLVSLIVLFVGRRMMNMFSAFFVKKGFCIPVSWFKVWCLGNNICEKYAFTFIQHSRSTLWLISTEAYNYPETCKFRLFAQNHAGFFGLAVQLEARKFSCSNTESENWRHPCLQNIQSRNLPVLNTSPSNSITQYWALSRFTSILYKIIKSYMLLILSSSQM